MASKSLLIVIAYFFIQCMMWSKAAQVAASDTEDTHYLSFGNICKSLGYPYEQHKVTTYDGYILTIFRIPGKKNEPLQTAIQAKRPALLLWHGIFQSADDFIINDEQYAPGFVFANNGYDVWVANSRGNKYSREHRFLDPDRDADKSSFFGFSVDEMGLYDSNSTIEYIKTQTGKAKIGVVGLSLGAEQFLISMINNSTYYASSVAVFTTLGAVSIMNHTENFMFRAAYNNDYYLNTLKSNQIYELFPANKVSAAFYTIACQAIPAFCEFITSDIIKEDINLLNKDKIDEALAHFPAGTSTRTFEHIIQVMKAGRFQKYDFGVDLNRLIYKSDIPPAYDLSKIKGMKIIQVVGESDTTAHPIDNQWLRDQLGTNVIYYATYRLCHTCFALSTNPKYLYDLIELFKKNSWA